MQEICSSWTGGMMSEQDELVGTRGGHDEEKKRRHEGRWDNSSSGQASRSATMGHVEVKKGSEAERGASWCLCEIARLGEAYRSDILSNAATARRGVKQVTTGETMPRRAESGRVNRKGVRWSS